MIARLAAIAGAELRIASRNRWIILAALVMVAFSLILTLAGSAPTGTLGVDRLTLAVSSLATLSVYLVPLIALALSYEAFAGERERGTMPLLLTYPVSRFEIIAGKFVAQFLTLAAAVAAGYGLTALALWLSGDTSPAGFGHLGRLTFGALALGATFIAIGFAISVAARAPAIAAGIAVAVWLVAVVLLDIALLGALVADNGGVFTKTVFPLVMVVSPTDAFRLLTLAPLDPEIVEAGIGGASRGLAPSPDAALVSLLAWPVAALALAGLLFRRAEP